MHDYNALVQVMGWIDPSLCLCSFVALLSFFVCVHLCGAHLCVLICVVLICVVLICVALICAHFCFFQRDCP
jgi:hypothetical protein